MPDSDTQVTDKELRMAQQLVGELEGDFAPQDFHDEFRDKLQQLVEEKVKAGEGEHIMKPLEGEEIRGSADIVDLTELLRRSLRKGSAAANDEDEEKPARKTASRRKAANDEDEQPRKAAARKSGSRTSTTTAVKSRSARRKAA